jgi:hypothetical protein
MLGTADRPAPVEMTEFREESLVHKVRNLKLREPWPERIGIPSLPIE